MYIPRTLQDNLSRWLAETDRKPLILRGARQVGKSTLVRGFAQQQGLHLAEVNIEEHLTFVRPAFEEGSLAAIIAACSRVTGIDLTSNREPTLLFLDEIQAVPAALKALRYLYEKAPHLAVIAAGSVLEFALTDAEISMPVGRVSYLYMAPVTFKEFLAAKGLGDLAKVITAAHPLAPESLRLDHHEQLMRLLREYMVIGGMPAAVATFLQGGSERGSFSSPARIHADLLTSYRDDIQKYPATKHIRDVVREAFDRSPSQLGNKLKYSNLAPGQPSRDTKKAVNLLLAAGLLHAVVHSDAQGLPLGAGADRALAKLYYLDTGLLMAQLGFSTPWELPADAATLVNEGVLAEQFVAQEMLAALPEEQRPQLYYWVREKKAANAQVDFVLSIGPAVVPAEVKSGPAGQMKSLWEFCRTHKIVKALRFDAGLPSALEQTVHKPDGPTRVSLLTLPLYMASEVRRILAGTF